MKKSMIPRYLPRTLESFGSLDAPQVVLYMDRARLQHAHSKFVVPLPFRFLCLHNQISQICLILAFVIEICVHNLFKTGQQLLYSEPNFMIAMGLPFLLIIIRGLIF